MGEQTTVNHEPPEGAVCYRWVAHDWMTLGLWMIERHPGRDPELTLEAVFLASPRHTNGAISLPHAMYERQAADDAWPHWDHPECDAFTKVTLFPAPPTWAEVEAVFVAFYFDSPDNIAARGPNEDPDVFYRRIAEHYKRFALTTGTPVRSIAEAAGVPKTTAGNWITAARKRGLLPPTSKGKARA